MPMLAAPAVPAQLMEGRGATVTYLWESGWVPFGVLWNSTGQPAASVPAGFDADGLPLAVQLVGAPAWRRHAADACRGDRGRAAVGTSPSRRLRLLACRRRMAGCRICSGDLELKVQGNGAAVTAAALSPSAHAVGGHGDLLACRECGTVQQPILPARRRAARPLPRHARRRVPERGGRPARDREPPARPDRRPRPERPAARRRLRPRPAARRGAPARLRDRRARALARGARGTPARRSGSTSARSRWRLQRGRATATRPASSTSIVLADVLEHLDDPVDAIDRCARLLRPGGRAVRRHARPVVADRAARRRALVGLPARAHRAAAAPHAARADLRRAAS